MESESFMLSALKQEIDQQIYELGKRIASLDDPIASIKPLKLQANSLSEVCKEHKLDLEERKKEHKKLLEDFQASHSTLSSQSQGHHVCLNELKADSVSLKAQVASLKSSQDAVSQHVYQKLQPKLDVLPQLQQAQESLKQELSEVSKSSQANKAELLKKHSEADTRADNLYAQHFSQVQEIQKLKQEIQELRESFKFMNSVISSASENANSHLNAEVYELKEWVNKLFKALAIPDPKDFPSRLDIEKIKSDFESVVLEAKNAFLKASNAETQIQLQNKKIENVQLLLKRQELDKA